MRPFSLIFNETAKHNINFSRSRDSLVIINPNKIQSELNPADQEKQDTLKITRKYFSKKITNLLSFHQSSSTASAYRCKAIKSLKLYGSALQRCPLRRTKKIELFLDSAEPLLTQEQTDLTRKEKKHTFINQLYGYKSLEFLEVRAGQQTDSLAPVKSLRNLKELTLTLNVNQIAANSGAFLRLKSLKKFSLTLLKYKGIQQEDSFDAVANFCEKILSKQGLESVHLNLKGLSFNVNSKPIERLLDVLERSQSLNFNVQLSLPTQYNLDPRKLQTALNYVDLMTLSHVTGPSFSFSNRESWENSQSQAKRKLEITISHFGLAFLNNPRQMSDRPFNVLESINSFFKQNIDRSFPLVDKLQAKNLQSFTFSFDRMPEEKVTAMCTDLAYVLKNSPNLKYLNLKGLKIYPFVNGQYAKQNHAIFEAIASLRDLESLHLEDISLAEVSFKLINKTLAGLYSLKSLHLSFNIRFEPEVLNSYFNFKNLRKLTDLGLKLPALNHKAQVSFIDNLIHMRNLQTMNIKEGSQLFKNPGLRWKLLKGMDSLVSLRDVEISSPCTLTQSHFGYGRQDVQDNKRIAADIRDKLDELFDHNEYLKKFIVIEPNCYEVKATRY